ncbi:MAG TPA: transposase [Chryseolinea sp.]|nr:transposase [Chryseolinea sp.]
MNSKKKVTIRYSEAFKHQVINEVESGVTCAQVRKKYGIGGINTIQYWMKRLGKLESLPKVIRVEKPDEKSKVEGPGTSNTGTEECLGRNSGSLCDC